VPSGFSLPDVSQADCHIAAYAARFRAMSGTAAYSDADHAAMVQRRVAALGVVEVGLIDISNQADMVTPHRAAMV
jgi:hypothetical protein